MNNNLTVNLTMLQCIYLNNKYFNNDDEKVKSKLHEIVRLHKNLALVHDKKSVYLYSNNELLTFNERYEAIKYIAMNKLENYVIADSKSVEVFKDGFNINHYNYFGSGNLAMM